MNNTLGKGVLEISYEFSLCVVRLTAELNRKREYTLSKQLLKSGTSIGANVEEAQGALTKKDFIHKISIAYKEARETHYWIRLLRDTEHISEQEYKNLQDSSLSLKKILAKILITSKKNL